MSALWGKALATFLLLIVFCGMRAVGAPAAPPNLPYERALGQFESGKFREATATLSSALQHAPDSVASELLLAQCYYELKDWDNAAAHAESAAQMNPSDAETHLWLGRIYGRKAEQARSLGLATKTRKEFEQAVALAPNYVEARRDLMEFYLNAPWIVGGGKNKARKQADAIAAISPIEGALAWAHFDEFTGQLLLAQQGYQQVVTMKTDRPGPYFEAADFYLTHHDASGLTQAVEAAGKADASDVRLYYYRGVAEILRGDRLEDAQNNLKTYVAQAPQGDGFPSRAEALTWLGQLYERSGKSQLAAEQYHAALQMNPNLEEARQALERVERHP